MKTKTIITIIIALITIGCNSTAHRYNLIANEANRSKVKWTLPNILLNAQYASRQGKYTTAYNFEPTDDITEIIKTLKGPGMRFGVRVDSNEIFKAIIVEWKK